MVVGSGEGRSTSAGSAASRVSAVTMRADYVAVSDSFGWVRRAKVEMRPAIENTVRQLLSVPTA